MKNALLLIILFGIFACKNGDAAPIADGPIDISATIDLIRTSDRVKNALNGFQMLEVNCDSMISLLDEAYRKDQEVRQQGGDMQLIDQQNQKVVISLIEECGFPTMEEAGQHGYTAIFLVLQHSAGGIIGRYYPPLAAAVERGEINKSTFALMQDRLLMNFGYKQIYGSQIMNDQLYELQAPETVNERRAEVGLGPIEAYLKYFKLDFEKEIARMQGSGS